MNEKILFALIFVAGVFISSVSQIILKKSADIEYPNKIREYLNGRVIFSYIIFFGATLCSILAYTRNLFWGNALFDSCIYKDPAFTRTDFRVKRIYLCCCDEPIVPQRKDNKAKNAWTFDYYNWNYNICYIIFGYLQR